MESRTESPRRRLRAHWLGRIAYRPAWTLQQALASARADGRLDEDHLLLLEHDRVLTLGRNADEQHVRATRDWLAQHGIDVVRVERGGEVTYHGPGQLVAYPIVALGTAGTRATGATGATGGTGGTALGVRRFVGALEDAMAAASAEFGVTVGPREGYPGAWVAAERPLPRKIGALGIRVARGVSFHGIALNVTTDLADFDLIDPCGLPGLRSTSVARERARAHDRPELTAVDATTPSTESVAAVAAPFARALAHGLGADLVGALPLQAEPAAERQALETLVGALDGALAGTVAR